MGEKKMIQEDFRVVEESNYSGERTVRPNRFRNIDCTMKIDGKDFKVLDYSATGIAVLSSDMIFEEKKSYHGSLVLAGKEIANFSLAKARESNHIDGDKLIAFEFEGDLLDHHRINTLVELLNITTKQFGRLEEESHISPEFKYEVYLAKDLLQSLEKHLEEWAGSKSFESNEELMSFENEVTTFMGDQFQEIFEMFYTKFTKLVENLSDKEMVSYQNFFRDQLSHLIYQAPFSSRSYYKPLGYAGDYEMMNQIYRHETIGKSLFAKCLQKYFVSHPNAQAVRNRVEYLNGKIRNTVAASKSDKVKILSVACGPAKELQMLINTESQEFLDKVEIHLLDQDLSALKETQIRIKKICKERGVNVDIKFLHRAIKDIIIDGMPFDGYELVYSAGPFDYFTDRVCTTAGQRFYDALSENGEVVIGNFDLAGNKKFIMDYALDWRLIYRSPEQLKQIFHSVDPKVSIEQEEQGINLFVSMKK